MAKGKVDLPRLVVAIGIVIGAGCSTGAIRHPDAEQPDAGTDRGTSEEPDTGADAAPQNTVACRVAVDNALSRAPRRSSTRKHGIKEPTSVWRTTAPPASGIRAVKPTTSGTVRTLAASWSPGTGSRARSSVDGLASAVVADAWTKGEVMTCLTVDSGEWTWLLGFDPGPPTVAVRLATDPARSTPQALRWDWRHPWWKRDRGVRSDVSLLVHRRCARGRPPTTGHFVRWRRRYRLRLREDINRCGHTAATDGRHLCRAQLSDAGDNFDWISIRSEFLDNEGRRRVLRPIQRLLVQWRSDANSEGDRLRQGRVGLRHRAMSSIRPGDLSCLGCSGKRWSPFALRCQPPPSSIDEVFRRQPGLFSEIDPIWNVCGSTSWFSGTPTSPDRRPCGRAATREITGRRRPTRG